MRLKPGAFAKLLAMSLGQREGIQDGHSLCAAVAETNSGKAGNF
jgi:hypothetical protein